MKFIDASEALEPSPAGVCGGDSIVKEGLTEAKTTNQLVRDSLHRPRKGRRFRRTLRDTGRQSNRSPSNRGAGSGRDPKRPRACLQSRSCSRDRVTRSRDRAAQSKHVRKRVRKSEKERN